LYYVATYLIGLFIQAVYPDFSNVNDSSIQSMAAENYAIMLIGTVLLVPLTEETLFRGLIFRKLHQKSRAVAYILSTLFFGLIHITGYIGATPLPVLLLCLIQYIPAGVFLAWAYEKADSIWAPILMHMAVNQISMSYMR
jgi:membrane protease YdiL (CAAX protease family)